MNDSQISVRLNMEDPEGWRALVPTPFWTTKGVRFWKRWNEENWLPQCSHCGQVFKDEREYDEHYMIYVAKWPSNFTDNWQQYVAKGDSDA